MDHPSRSPGRAGGSSVSEDELCEYRAFEPTWVKLRAFASQPEVARKLRAAQEATGCRFTLEIEVKGSALDVSREEEWVDGKMRPYLVYYLGYSSHWQMHA